MAHSGIGSINTEINPIQNVFRGGGQNEAAFKGGNTSDPADTSSLTGAATVQQTNAPVANVELPGAGGVGGFGTPSSEGIGAIQANMEGRGQKVNVMA
jgi:hypothetical protein